LALTSVERVRQDRMMIANPEFIESRAT